jgi:uncharacterized membrane protein
MEYLIVKWLHILSSTILFGTGIGSAFYMFMANRGRRIEDIGFATRHVVVADWIFTTPAILFQLGSGLYLVHLGGYHLSDKWIAETLGLFVFTGACWTPVVWVQIKMRNMAREALEKKHDLPSRYWTYDRWWILLGALAFPAVALIFWLMVTKPV